MKYNPGMLGDHFSYFLLLFFQATLLVSAAVLLTWLVSLKMGCAALMDVVWCALFTPLVLSYAGLADGFAMRRWIIALMVCAWSLRLALHLWRRIRGPRPGVLREDPRYEELRKKWGDRAESKFLFLFMLQGLLCLLFSAPFALICLNPAREISPVEWAGLAIWVVGWIGEALADRQLAEFKESLSGKGTLSQGLWKYSRHPNYFFEWVIWCGYFVFALGSPWGWIAIYCPVIMYYILNHVTGVPLAEAQALRTRGADYRAYQERTSAFFPCLPK